MKAAGVDMEWFVGTLGSLIVATGKTGTELARSLRTITARIFQQKETLEEMGESTEGLEIQMAKAEKALSELGITIRGQATGELLPLSDIIKQLAEKWGDLSDASRFFIAEQLAGKTQMDTLIGWLDSYSSSVKLVEAAYKSNGTLMDMNATYAESLEGKLNSLKTAQNELYQTILSSDAYKTIIDSLATALNFITDLAQLLEGKFLAATVGATTAVTYFMQALKGYSLKDQIVLLGQWIAEKVALTSTTNLATVAVIGFKTALVGLGVGAAVVAIGAIVKAFKDARVEIDEVSEAVNEFNDSMSTHIETDKEIKRFKELNDLLSSNNLEANERIEYESELANIVDSLIGKNETFKRILEDETAEYDKQYQAMKNMNDIATRQTARDGLANTDLSDRQKLELTEDSERLAHLIVGDYKAMTDEIEKQKALTEEMANAKTDKERLKIQKQIEESVEREKNYRDLIDEQYISLQSQTDTMNAYNQSNALATEAGVAHDREDFNLDGIIAEAEEAVNSINTVNQQAEKSYDNLKKVIENTGESIEQTGQKWVQSESERAAAMTKANEGYITSLESLRDAREVLENISDGDYNLDDMRALVNAFPDFAGDINDAGQAIDYVSDQIETMENAAENAYVNMLAQDANLWEQKIANSDHWKNHVADSMESINELNKAMLGEELDDFNTYIQQKGLGYEIDLSNAGSAAEADMMMQNQLVNQLLRYWAQYTIDKGEYREGDSVGIADFLNWQGVSEATTIEELKKLWAAYYNAKMAEIQSTIDTIQGSIGDYQDLGNVSPEQMKQLTQANKQLAQLQKLNQQLDGGNAFDKISTSFTNTVKKFGSGINLGSLTKPSSSGSSSNKGSSSSSEKTVEDLDLEIDRYYTLNDAIEDVNNKLDENQKKQEKAKTAKEYNKLLDERKNLLNDNVKALQNLLKEQQKEANELKNTLAGEGFKFDKEGNITNYGDRLLQLQKAANKLTGEAKEAAIANVNAIVSMIDQYTKLTNDSIPDTKNQILDLQDELEDLKKIQEEINKAIEVMGDRYYNVLQALTKVNNQLSLIDALQEHATGVDRVKLLDYEIKLLKEKQKVLREQQQEAVEEAQEIGKQLASLGIEFAEDGDILNYDQIIQQLKDYAQSLVGTARDEEIEGIQNLIDLIEQYDQVVKETLPSLSVEWLNVNNEIISLEKSKLETIAEMEKQISDAIANELQKRTDATKKELNKQKDLYLKQYEEEDYQSDLADEQKKLDEIQQQINNLSRDTSLAGQLRLQELMRQYQEQQDVINNMIRENAKKEGSERFDEEQEKLDEELEEALDPENMAQMVATALKTGMVAIGDEVIKLDDLMTDFAVESQGAITALSQTIRQEMIDSLQEASLLVQQLGTDYESLLGFNSALNNSRMLSDLSANSRSGGVAFNAPLLNVEGDIAQDVESRLTELAQYLEETITGSITRALQTI